MSSTYIDQQRKDYALYVLEQRAIPHITDGLKSAGRRIIWIARSGDKFKSATLAGATLPLHPHAPPEGSINSLAGTYINNVPLLTGYGSFGTRLNPHSFGAARYTSVKVSAFTKDVMFKDIELIPMISNYDNTLEEPKHFLPLIPSILLNASQGIAIGYSSIILPRLLKDIVNQQIRHLKGKPIISAVPKVNGGEGRTIEENRWSFYGSFEKLHSSAVRILDIPYDVPHEKYISFLIKLQGVGKISDFIDDSKDKINITVKFKRADMAKISDMGKFLKLENSITENMNMICDSKIVNMDFVSVIEWFTDWRLGWYQVRFERLLIILEEQILRYKDIIRAINKNVAGAAKKTVSRAELKEYLEVIGVVNLDYIADLSIYRFTEEEKIKTRAKLENALKLAKKYNKILGSEKMQRDIYVSELNEILENDNKGKYK